MFYVLAVTPVCQRARDVIGSSDNKCLSISDTIIK